jgi:hypothetical protein
VKSFPTNLLFSTLVLAAALTANIARADDQFFIYDGSESRAQTNPVQKTYSYGFEYIHGLNDYLSYGFGYGNEGHFDQGIEHHRDYDGADLWAHTDVLNHQLRLALGFGPVFYYDTTGGTYGHSTEDLHGFGTRTSLSATLNTFSPLLLQIRTDFVNGGSFNERSVMLGIGYQLDAKESTHSSDAGGGYGDTRNEVTFYGGSSVINLSGEGHAKTFGLEYRRDLSDYFQWTAGLLDEGKSSLADRKGLTSELWLVQSLFDNRMSIGAAAGLYLAHDSLRPDDSTFVTLMGSVTAAYQVIPNVTVRLTWDRVITNYSRDSDLFKLGVGYRF